MPTYEALLIPEDSTEPVRRVTCGGEDPDDSLHTLQDLVGGFIEALPSPTDDDGITAYIYDEGKFCKGKNDRATRLWGPRLFAGDYIAGNVVVCGFDIATGENTSLPEGWEDEHLAEGAHARALRDPDEVRVDLDQRRISYRWKLYDVPATEHDGPGEEYAVLSCRHLGAGRSCYSASLSNQTERKERGYLTTSLRLGDGVYVASEMTSRYNRKQLEAFGEKALSSLRAFYENSDERVTRYFRAGPVAAGAI